MGQLTDREIDEATLKLSNALKLTLQQHYKTNLKTLRMEDRTADLVRLRRMFCAYVFYYHKDLPYKVTQAILEKKTHGAIISLIKLHDNDIEVYPLYQVQYQLFVERFIKNLESDILKKQLEDFRILVDEYTKQYQLIQKTILAK